MPMTTVTHKKTQASEGQSVGKTIERIATSLAGRIGFAAQEIGGNEVIAFNGEAVNRQRSWGAPALPVRPH